jgi:hypothetical protein
MYRMDLWVGECLREQLMPAQFCNFVNSRCHPAEPKLRQGLMGRPKPPDGNLCLWQRDVPKELPASPDALVRKTNLSFSTVSRDADGVSLKEFGTKSCRVSYW